MRDQTAILNAGAHSVPLNELSQVLEAVAIRVGLFLFRLACAYVAFCYAVPTSAIKTIEESNP
jgi:hypothetical protein